MYGKDRWPSGGVSAVHNVVAGSISSCCDRGIHDNEAETALRCSVCHMWAFVGLSSHGYYIIIYVWSDF